MKSLEGYARAVTILLIAIVLLDIVSCLSEGSMILFLKGIQGGGAMDEARADALDRQQMILGVVQILAFVLCGVPFLGWFYRAYKNLRGAGLSGLKYRPGWAVGGFFVPFLNLVRPLEIMKEVWRGSAFLAGTSGEAEWQAIKPDPVVGLWWGLLLVSSMVAETAGRMEARADGIPELLTASFASILSGLIDIPAAIAAIHLVGSITRFQEQARAQWNTNVAALPDQGE
jgi:hypothetical protein